MLRAPAEVAIAEDRRALAASTNSDELFPGTLIVHDEGLALSAHDLFLYTGLLEVDMATFGARGRDALRFVVRALRA